MSLPLAERDLLLLQIEQEIKNKKSLLVKKKKDLDKKHKINHFIQQIRKHYIKINELKADDIIWHNIEKQDDYSKYYDYILKEKHQQSSALMLLKEYINDLIKTENLVDDQLRTAKHDQKDIIHEIDKVKDELDKLIE